MSKRLFIKKFLFNNKEIGSIIPSSNNLASKIVNKEDILNSEIIIELGAGGGVFTKKIFEYYEKSNSSKKIFIIEKDKDFYKILLNKFPKYKKFIFNIDVLNLENLLIENNISNIDLIISGLPFKSLPENIFNYIINNIIINYFNEKSKFIQFSYFKSFGKKLALYFNNIFIKKSLLNIPRAYVFKCSSLKKDAIKSISSK